MDIRHLGKYLRKSRVKFEKHFREACPELSDEEVKKLVDDRIRDELKSGVQTIQYQIK